MDLLEEGPPLVLGAGDDRLAVLYRLGEDALALDAGLLRRVGHQQLDLDHTFGGGGLGARLQFVDLGLRLAQQGGGPFLGLHHDAGRLLVRMAQYLRTVLAE